MLRRNFLQQSMGGFGWLALNGLLSGSQVSGSPPTAGGTGFHLSGSEAGRVDTDSGRGDRVPATHLPARAKSIIYLYMEGGPSQIDLFDHKPLLAKQAGRPLPFDTPATVFNSSKRAMPTPFRFRQHGESASWVSELFPHIASCVDDLTFVHSLHHTTSNHSAACYLSHTGDPISGRPSIGSWMSYGLGTENDNLPAFCVLDCGQAPSGGAATWSSGFLPASHAGVKFLRGPVPVEYLNSLDPNESISKAKLNAILSIAEQKRSDPTRLHLDAVIRNYEKAARMQATVPDLMDLSGESAETRKRYGLGNPQTEVFGSRCLLARRLVEQGVRFVELFSPRVNADRWDQHGSLKKGLTNNCIAVDQPIAGLIHDLKSRGLLDETIVLWGGEFGRTPSSQGTGRDHNPFGYTVFLAGGGFKPGIHYGATDEFGYYAVENKVHLHDLHATILHQMGVDHKKLTFRFDGRDYRLTDVHGKVIQPLIG
ncbi:MAG: DUF1501 domain-containing protein [Planctomycetota bacterium]|nr:DUF1501 domain-containing protein [Planctomycetota bacterium]